MLRKNGILMMLGSRHVIIRKLSTAQEINIELMKEVFPNCLTETL